MLNEYSPIFGKPNHILNNPYSAKKRVDLGRSYVNLLNINFFYLNKEELHKCRLNRIFIKIH